MGVGGVKNRSSLFGALVSFCIIWFVFPAVSANRRAGRTVVVPSGGVISEHLNLVGIERHHALHLSAGMVYVSKRRVPSGPDPIHNRRAEKSRQPPTRA